MNPEDIARITNGVVIALVVAAAGFLVSVLAPRFNRAIGRLLMNLGLGGLVRLHPSIWQVLLWSLKTTDAMLQVTKAYDWRVAQWSGFATAIMTATLAFVSAILVEYFKNPITIGVPLLKIAALGVLASCLVYLMAQRRITSLKNQFLETYSSLARLSRSPN